MSLIGEQFAPNACLKCGEKLQPKWTDCPSCGHHLTWAERVRSLPMAPYDEFSEGPFPTLEELKEMEKAQGIEYQTFTRSSYSPLPSFQIGPLRLNLLAIIGLVVILLAILLWVTVSVMRFRLQN